MKIKLIFAWYDFWIGFFYDKSKSWLYIFPIPMFGVILKFKCPRIFIRERIIRDLKALNYIGIQPDKFEVTVYNNMSCEVLHDDVRYYYHDFNKLSDDVDRICEKHTGRAGGFPYWMYPK